MAWATPMAALPGFEVNSGAGVAAASDRGRARNAMPNAFTNVSSPRPMVRAMRPSVTGRASASVVLARPSPWTSACSNVHSAANPLVTGSAAAPMAAIPNVHVVTGCDRIRPPSRSRSRSPVAWRIVPAPRNSTVLNAAWLTTRRRAATRAIVATASWPAFERSIPTPTAVTARPTFSVVE